MKEKNSHIYPTICLNVSFNYLHFLLSQCKQQKQRTDTKWKEALALFAGVTFQHFPPCFTHIHQNKWIPVCIWFQYWTVMEMDVRRDYLMNLDFLFCTIHIHSTLHVSIYTVLFLSPAYSIFYLLMVNIYFFILNFCVLLLYFLYL